MAEGEGEDDTIGVYVGGRNPAGERHGQGWAVLPNGDFYQGCYCRGMRNGKCRSHSAATAQEYHDEAAVTGLRRGLYVFMKSGARYEGEWRRHMKYGVGKMIYPDGSRYEGDWRNDLKHGFGGYYYPNGDVYEGAWFKGKRHGLGTYFYAETCVKFMGTWIEGVIQGPGQIIYPKHRYYGSWTRNVPKGRGCFVFEANCMQHGFYLLVNEKSEKELGEGEEEEKEEEKYNFEEEVELDETLGKTPMWRARNVTAFVAELLPPEPVPVPVHDSIPSLSECTMDFDLMQFEEPSVKGVGEEGQIDDDDWLLQRQQFLEDPTKTD
ncbi:hypothetical protein EVAR_145_1 [Eumeta japonica]|uniref:Radial spoke head 1 homolog n=1 Tax=Eumeta variegata TaxID=151549 RepID=A0A4C1SBL5_EUMVA|nr:hypothetical protein EVAR_145_1 [Eumeta japonica]